VNQVVIGLVNPDMIKEFLSMEKMFLFPKKVAFIGNMKRMLGEGVAFSEGDVWKTKRKIITHVFNFDFLKSIIPRISLICDEELVKTEHD
jgi:cytochrome P450